MAGGSNDVPSPDPGRPPQAPVRRGSRGEGKGRRRKRGMGAVGVFLLFGAAPVGLAIWFFVQPEWRRQQILDKVPDGAGGRAIKAAVCVAVLIALARLALPAFHGAASTLYDALTRIRSRPTAMRVLLFPAELVLWLLWFGMQMLVAVDAAMIIATCLALLLLVARIFQPELLPNVLPELLR